MVTEPATLGFIGTGVMGGRMCRNLARKSGRPMRPGNLPLVREVKGSSPTVAYRHTASGRRLRLDVP